MPHRLEIDHLVRVATNRSGKRTTQERVAAIKGLRKVAEDPEKEEAALGALINTFRLTTDDRVFNAALDAATQIKSTISERERKDSSIEVD